MKINRLTLVSRSPSRNGSARGFFQCDCGTIKEIDIAAVRSGNTKSCGCLQQENRRRAKYKNHGMCGTPTYYSWTAMLSRCRYAGRPYYHEKGIKVCQRWSKFENFLADMGERPKGTTLDRIDPNGNYEPSNCRWIDMKQQARNRTNNALVTHSGKTLTIQEWSEITNIPYATIHARLARGWSEEKALTAPIDTSKHSKSKPPSTISSPQ